MNANEYSDGQELRLLVTADSLKGRDLDLSVFFETLPLPSPFCPFSALSSKGASKGSFWFSEFRKCISFTLVVDGSYQNRQ